MFLRFPRCYISFFRSLSFSFLFRPLAFFFRRPSFSRHFSSFNFRPFYCPPSHFFLHSCHEFFHFPFLLSCFFYLPRTISFLLLFALFLSNFTWRSSFLIQVRFSFVSRSDALRYFLRKYYNPRPSGKIESNIFSKGNSFLRI